MWVRTAKMIVVITSLKLTAYIEESGANLSGEAIRNHLKRANRVHQINNVGLYGEDCPVYLVLMTNSVPGPQRISKVMLDWL